MEHLEAELEAEVQRLQEDVSDLHRQLQETHSVMSFDFRGNLLHALGVLCGQAAVSPERQKVASQLRDEVEEMERDVQRQRQMNGFGVSSCRRRTVPCDQAAVARTAGGSSSSQQVSVAGLCSDLDFQLEFNLTQLKFGDKTKRTVRDLNVVMENSDLQSFSSFLSRVEETQDLLLFLRTLRTFSDRCDERCRTFTHFQVKYPSMVSLPGGQRSEVMALRQPGLPGCVLLVQWSVQVKKEGGVTASIDLLHKIPQTALQLFQSSPLEGAAEAFHSLQRILGVEGALEAVVMAMAASHDQ